jgi:DNA-binding transcriptional regulator YbjK
VSRDGPRNHQLRQRIAQLAAQLMAEHGIRDHALAKRKAARQLGVTAASILPGNEEIDEALKAYLTLFEADSHEQDLNTLRRQAADVMDVLARFHPVLTGALAQGAASRHSNIELEVYSDSSKEFEQFLLNADIAFKSEERRSGSFFILFAEPVDVEVRILPVQNLQSAPRSSGDARRRVTTEQLLQLIAADAVAGPAD